MQVDTSWIVLPVTQRSGGKKNRDPGGASPVKGRRFPDGSFYSPDPDNPAAFLCILVLREMRSHVPDVTEKRRRFFLLEVILLHNRKFPENTLFRAGFLLFPYLLKVDGIIWQVPPYYYPTGSIMAL